MNRRRRRKSDRVFQDKYRIHMIGIGGAGMSGIAEVLLNMGHHVTGSDLKANLITERLRSLGATIHLGHSADNLDVADVVVISSAVSSENSEVVAARARKIPVIPRAEMLAELMRLKYCVTIAGAHGKTTTTSMVGLLLQAAKFDPTIVIGGRVQALGSNARAGAGEFIVVEADESDRSFLKLYATIAIITNIDAEHLDHYSDLEDIKRSFVQFANKVPFYGVVILCVDDENNRSIIPHIERKVITYGFSADADFRAVPLNAKEYSSEFQVYHKEMNLGRVRLNFPGEHSIRNSLGAIAVASQLRISFDTARKSLAHFQGVDRRFQLKAHAKDIMIIDDYAHHPTEIRATLHAAKSGWNRRMLVVFQPHRYSRMYHLMDGFRHCFEDADQLILTDIYAAGEKPIEGVSVQSLARTMSDGNVIVHDNLETLPERVLRLAQPGDMILFLGAGSITTVADRTARMLTESSEIRGDEGQETPKAQ